MARLQPLRGCCVVPVLSTPWLLTARSVLRLATVESSPKLLFWGLVATSAVLSVWLGASSGFTYPGPSILLYAAFVPCFLACMIEGVMSTLDRQRHLVAESERSSLPYRRDWTMLISQGIVAP